MAVNNASEAPTIVLAGDGADTTLIDSLVRDGRTVLVLSRETAARLPGYAVAGEGGDNQISACRAHRAWRIVEWRAHESR